MMKKFLVLGLALSLTACGFTPMHAPSAVAGKPAFKNIQVDLVTPEDIAHDHGAFYVQQALYDRLGTQGRTHVLKIMPEFSRSGLGISAQDVATRFDVRIRMPYELTDAKTGDLLDRGTVSATTTFGAPIDPYGREASEQSATENVAREAADRLLVRLSAYYAKDDKGSDATP